MAGPIQGTKGTASGAASMTLSFPGAVHAGNLLVSSMQTANTTGGTTSDNVNAGNYSTGINHSTANTANDIAVFYKENTLVGTPTVTLTPGAAGDIGCCIEEYSGALTAASIDKNGATEVNGTSITSGSLTNTGANGDLCVGTLSSATQNVSNSNSTSGWTVDQNNSPNATMDAVLASRVQIPAAAFTTTFTVGGAAQDLCVAIVSFKLAAAASTVPPFNQPFPRISGQGAG